MNTYVLIMIQVDIMILTWINSKGNLNVLSLQFSVALRKDS